MDNDASAGGQGVFSYTNWRAALAGQPPRWAYECPLFTDARIIGDAETGYGPYQVFNLLHRPSESHARPALALRVTGYDSPHTATAPMRATDEGRYHGGLLRDELAALLSLCLGIRLRAGGISRLFAPDADPRGQPVDWAGDEDPLVPPSGSKPVLPRALGERDLALAAPLAGLVALSPPQSVALVRAARLYQEGLWLAEGVPELAWLLLVAAVESAAGFWRAADEAPVARLRASRPALTELLAGQGGEDFLALVAAELVPYLGATRKFIDFVLAFLPPAPDVRPVEYYQYSWTPRAMKRGLGTIYGYRSRALHGGVPFPAPMCRAPMTDPHGALMEICTPIAEATRGGTWLAGDIPMPLHTFEYVVRHALLGWWRSLGPASLTDIEIDAGDQKHTHP